MTLVRNQPDRLLCSRDEQNNIATYRSTIINCANTDYTSYTKFPFNNVRYPGNYHQRRANDTIPQCTIVFRVVSEKLISPDNTNQISWHSTNYHYLKTLYERSSFASFASDNAYYSEYSASSEQKKKMIDET